MTRQDVLQKIKENPDVSVLIIGAGVNGIGTFRDLALQGVDALIVDQADFSSGASAGSSHMLHGGIRYLENGEFRLVNEALRERNRMLENAPHYSKPLKTTIPIFRLFSGLLNAPLKFLDLLNRPGERGAVVIKAGLTMYDWFVRSHRNMPTHEFKLRDAALQQYPKMNPDIVCAATYYDAWMPYPERICLEMIVDAEEANPNSHALNYVSAIGGDNDSITLKDQLTGDEFTVKPKVVVNAAGPWIDFVNKFMGADAQRFIGGTKGSHLILDHPELYEACNGSEIFFENDDGRIVLIFPYVGRVMVGTTDIRIDNPDEAVCTDDEIDYILGMIDKVFPSITVDKSQIVFTFSGVRPLPYMDANSTGQISRDHSIKTVPATGGLQYPIHSLVGGKWTSFRAFSEETADVVLQNLSRSRSTSTANVSIGGGRGYPRSEDAKQAWLQKLQHKTELSLERLDELFERYGTRAEVFADFISQANDKPLQYMPTYSQREIEFIAKEEKLAHLEDLVLRRSLIGMLGYLNVDLLNELADITATAMGWSDAQKQEEIQRTIDVLSKKHRTKIGEASALN
jgi:glycerol-3-phosphate dehydrogenase